MAGVVRYQASDRTGEVQIFDDDARVEQRGVIVQHQHRNLAQRIEFRDTGRSVARGINYEFVINTLLRQHDANFAAVWAGRRCNQLHVLLLFRA